MSDKFYVGLDVTGFQDNGKRPPIDSVTLQVDNATVVTAGAYGGHDLYALCPYATQIGRASCRDRVLRLV